MKAIVGLACCLGLSALCVACGDPAGRPVSPEPPPQPRSLPRPSPTPARPERPVERLDRLEAAGRPPLELSAVAVQGYPPLPTYQATVRNATDRPVRRVIATVVYLDSRGRVLPGENQDVAFGSPLKAIEPGVTLDTKFLSRVDSASEVRLVVRVVTFLDEGPDADPVPHEWKNPRYDADLAKAEGRR
ncbi:MAG: hypothetical protein HY900_07300 [Deltaproteobacteria bacterium]|nr:hypothetical protein [Deltaproteobacteria bacterium]